MLDFIKSRWNSRRQQSTQSLSFSRPLIVLQSNDWGRIGVRDREGYEQLRASGIHLGENPYDYYSLETAEDVIALRDMLKRHRDSTGRPACIVMNFLLANLDFQKTADTAFQKIHLLPLSQGLPGAWKTAGTVRGLPAGHCRRRLLSGASRADPFLPAGGAAGTDDTRRP